MSNSIMGMGVGLEAALVTAKAKLDNAIAALNSVKKYPPGSITPMEFGSIASSQRHILGSMKKTIKEATDELAVANSNLDQWVNWLISPRPENGRSRAGANANLVLSQGGGARRRRGTHKVRSRKQRK